MFNELPLSGSGRRPTRTRWTFLLSLGGELTVLAVLLLIPLIYVQGLPGWHETILVPPPPPSAAPNVARATTQTPPRGATMVTVPAFIPPHAVVIHDSFARSSSPGSGTVPILGTIPGAGNDSRWTSILPSTNPTPPATQPAGPSRIQQVGGNVEAAKLIRMVRPFYPSIARQAHIEGTVVLSAIIGNDGTVELLHYVSGPPLLVQAAIDAVRQWRYEPTLLNGRPVAVETTIKVIFTLGDAGGGASGPQMGAASADASSTQGGRVDIRVSPHRTILSKRALAALRRQVRQPRLLPITSG